jgi:hypothetical protein
MISPELVAALSRSRQLELAAEADRRRATLAARRCPRPSGTARFAVRRRAGLALVSLGLHLVASAPAAG